MKRMLTLFLFLLLGECLSAQSVLKVQSFDSPSLGKTERYQIYLPDGYDKNNTQRYPVAYLLHGALGSHLTFSFAKSILDQLITGKAIQPMIVVMPNGSQGDFGGSMWANSELYGNVADYVVKDLVKEIDTKYRTVAKQSARCILGHSMGADGAVRIGLSNQDVFCGVAAHSGSLDFSQVTVFFGLVLQEQKAQKDDPPYEFKPEDGFATGAVFRAAGAGSPNLNNSPYFVDYPLNENGGTVESVLKRWQVINPAFTVKNNPPKGSFGLYFDCGTSDQLGFFSFNKGFRDTLLKYKIKHRWEPFAGDHSNMLSERLTISLPYLSNLMQSLSTPVSKPNLAEKMELKVFPNPSTDEINLEVSARSEAEVEVILQNVVGQNLKVLQANWKLLPAQNNKLQVNLGQQMPGTYWIVLRNGEGMVSSPVQVLR
jgi:enterochelin esterase-like enzyme